MPFKFIPDPDFFKQIVAEGKVTEALDKVADAILPTAKALAEAKGLTVYAASLSSTSGTRPKGRTYAEVIADTEDATTYEYGDTNTERLRILGTAAGVTIFPS